MRKLFVYIMLIGVTTCWTACYQANPLLTATHQDWKFIQKVGGMEIGELQALSSGEYFLPINIDISGTTTVTNKPERINSGLAIQSIRADVKGNDILLWVNTCLVSKAYSSPISKGITIGKLNNGNYSVKYLNNDSSTQDIRLVIANGTVH